MAPHSSILAWRIPTDRGAWRATVQGVQSQTRLSTQDITFTGSLSRSETFHCSPLSYQHSPNSLRFQAS